MALIRDGRTCVIVGVSINLLFLVLKFGAYIYTHVNLFFADAVDSVADAFILALLLLFLSCDFRTRVTFLHMDIMFACQWSAVLLFRVVILLDQLSDLVSPEPRKEPVLIIAVSCIVLALSLVLALVFVDEDDVIKEFISADEKAHRKLLRARTPKPSTTSSVMPIFAEALDNIATTAVALLVGCFLYAGVGVGYLYIVDDAGNILISCIMMYVAVNSLRELSVKYAGKSQFRVIYDLNEAEAAASSEPLLNAPLLP